MRWLRFAALLLVVTVLQAGLLAHLNIRPDLLLILLVFFAIYCNTTEAIITSFAIGFAADIISSTMGPRIISFGLFGTALAYLHRVIAIRRMPYQSTAIFVVGLLAGALVYLLALLKGQSVTANIYTVLFGIPLYSAMAGPFLFLPSAWWMCIKTHRFSKS